jgi:hypothetical protein
MKQSVKAPNEDGDCFKYICRKFPALMFKKVTEIFVEPQNRELTFDD